MYTITPEQRGSDLLGKDFVGSSIQEQAYVNVEAKAKEEEISLQAVA